MVDESEMNAIADMIWASMHPCEVCRLHRAISCEHCKLPEEKKRTGSRWNFWNGSVFPVEE